MPKLTNEVEAKIPHPVSEEIFYRTTMIICSGCHFAICEEEIMCVTDIQKYWHTRCMRCSECSQLIEETGFYRNSQLYCTKDFYKLFGRKCAVCDELVENQQTVRILDNKYFHEDCFVCSICSNKFRTGDCFHTVYERLLLCPNDYKSLKRSYENMTGLKNRKDRCGNSAKKFCTAATNAEAAHHRFNSESSESIADNGTICEATEIDEKSETDKNNLSDCEFDPEIENHMIRDVESTEAIEDQLDDSNRINNDASKSERSEQTDDEGIKGDHKMGTNGKKRGPRTTIKAKQLEMLKAAFSTTPKPTRHAREQLATDTGLNMRVIQVWFQNRRSKERRMRQMTIAASRRHWAIRNFTAPNGLTPQYEIIDPGAGYYDPRQFPQFQGFYCPEFYEQQAGIMEQQSAQFQRPTPQFQDPVMNLKGMSTVPIQNSLPVINHQPSCSVPPMGYRQFVNPEYNLVPNLHTNNAFANPVNVFEQTPNGYVDGRQKGMNCEPPSDIDDLSGDSYLTDNKRRHEQR